MGRSYSTVAYRARLEKEKHPETFCPVRGCLWRVKHPRGGPDTPCRKHGVSHVDPKAAPSRDS